MGTVHSYISKFHDIISHLKLSKQTKLSESCQGLKENLKKALIGVTVPATLEQFEPKVIQIDNDLHEYNMERKNPKLKMNSINFNPTNNCSSTSSNSTPHPIIPVTEVIPVEIDASFQNQIKLTTNEGKRQMDGKLCMYTGCNIKDAEILAEHKNSCPIKNVIWSLGKAKFIQKYLHQLLTCPFKKQQVYKVQRLEVPLVFGSMA